MSKEPVVIKLQLHPALEEARRASFRIKTTVL